MTKLSVNVNKIATLRNSRGGNVPNLLRVAKDIELFGAQGITVHPRPDERHIRYQDARDLKKLVTTEYNIEGNPIEKFMDLVLEIQPTQVTLVPDAVDAITSNAGWDTIANRTFLREVISTFKQNNIRTSIFVDPDSKMVEGAAETGPDRIELYTESYARAFGGSDEQRVYQQFHEAALLARQLGLGVNAGHDLNQQNLAKFLTIPDILEVSIGHALTVESLLSGFETTLKNYLSIINDEDQADLL